MVHVDIRVLIADELLLNIPVNKETFLCVFFLGCFVLIFLKSLQVTSHVLRYLGQISVKSKVSYTKGILLDDSRLKKRKSIWEQNVKAQSEIF